MPRKASRVDVPSEPPAIVPGLPARRGRPSKEVSQRKFAGRLGKRIREFRLARGWTAERASKATYGNVSEGAWLDYESGAEPRASALIMIAYALDRRIEELVPPPVREIMGRRRVTEEEIRHAIGEHE